MGFMSALGNALKMGGKIGASFIPGVGPVASKVLDGISMGGDVLSNMGRVSGDAAKGVQDTRLLENQIAQGGDRNKLTRSGQQIDQTQGHDAQALQRAALLEKMGMDRAQMGIDAPMARTKQAAYGDALKNVQDVNIDFQGQTGPMSKFNVTGGIRPSMFGQNARDAGGELGRQALMALMSKSDVPAMTDVPEPSPLVEMPELSQPQGSGVLEKVLGGVGLGGSILGGIGDALKKQPPVMNSGMIDPETWRKQQLAKKAAPVPTLGMTDPNVFKKVSFG